jgi:hypothetical protein
LSALRAAVVNDISRNQTIDVASFSNFAFTMHVEGQSQKWNPMGIAYCPSRAFIAPQSATYLRHYHMPRLMLKYFLLGEVGIA